LLPPYHFLLLFRQDLVMAGKSMPLLLFLNNLLKANYSHMILRFENYKTELINGSLRVLILTLLFCLYL